MPGPEVCSEKPYRGGEGRWQVREQLVSEGDPISVITCSPSRLPALCTSLGLNNARRMSDVKSEM